MHVTGEEGDKWEEKVAVVRQHGKRGKEEREGEGGKEGGPTLDFPRRICNLKHGLV